MASGEGVHTEVTARPSPPNLSGEQIRAARLLLNWGVWRLAKKSTLSVRTLERAEGDDGSSKITSLQHSRLRQALEAAGVEFTAGPPGVRLREPAP